MAMFNISMIKKFLNIIIYHDLLPPPRRGSHVKAENTHAVIQHTPLSHIYLTPGP